MIRKLVLALALALLTPLAANAAATCYWVAGTSYNNAADWSSATGGTPSTCAATGGIPKNAGDTALLDANSPAATTLTLDVDIASMATIDMRTLTGGSGFDFSTHSVTFTTSFLSSGTGTRSLTMGSGTITIGNGGTWNNTTTTGETFTTGTATIVFAGGSSTSTFFGGGKTYNAITINGNTSGAVYQFEAGNPAAVNVGTLSINGPAVVSMRQAQTMTVTNAFNWAGTASAPIYFATDSASNVTTTLKATAASTCTWCIFRGVTGSTSTITATNSLDLGANGGTLSISAPTGGGGGGYIIGGQ